MRTKIQGVLQEQRVAFTTCRRSKHWKHPQTKGARRIKKVESATAMIWRLLRIAKLRFRKIDEQQPAAEVCRGTKLENGEIVRLQMTHVYALGNCTDVQYLQPSVQACQVRIARRSR
jgi:hypothetical protein